MKKKHKKIAPRFKKGDIVYRLSCITTYSKPKGPFTIVSDPIHSPATMVGGADYWYKIDGDLRGESDQTSAWDSQLHSPVFDTPLYKALNEET
jgi:hypothetical protein